ncbi:MAG: hypothetical protein HGA55_02880 [Methanoregulaceae archaeon]|nr:hypothetical protein [Methanoregulaceae archaeon]
MNVIPRELFGIPILAIGIAERLLPPRLADALNAPILRAVVGDLREDILSGAGNLKEWRMPPGEKVAEAVCEEQLHRGARS